MAYHPGQLTKFGMNRELAKKLMNGDAFTVAQLPSASAHKYRSIYPVTDLSAATFNATVGVSGKTVSGGGSIVARVSSDGTDWRVG